MTDLEGGRLGVDALFLANGAELQAGLVYTLGGAWSRCWPPPHLDYPYERQVPTVVVVRVPWHDTNVSHDFKIAYRDADGVDLIPAPNGQFTVGRQPDLTAGASQVVALALTPTIPIPRKGLYYVVVAIDETEAKRIEFEAITNPASAGSVAN